MIFANTKSGIGGKVVTAALLVLFFAASSAVVTSAADIYVPAGGNQNIQQAVNNASTGDTIIVRDGTYNENVYVNVTDLIIRSENGSGNCIVNAKYENTDVFFVAANYVTITGFTVQGATEFGYAGICLFGAGYCYISDNNVLNNGDGISILDSGYNLVANNIVTGNNYTGIYMELANANIVLGNTATNNGWEGIFIASSYNNTFIRNNASNNTIYEFYSDEYSQNNTVKDLQLCNNQTSVSFTYGNGAGLKCVDTVPTEPSEKRGISKYVETIEVCADSWLFLNMSYEEADLGCVAEDSLSMWEHSGTDWVEVAGTTGVNTAENYVYANITEFNILAPLGDTNGVSLEPLGSSNGLNCTFGNLCVNATGWWRDNGTFNASTTQQIQLAINNASEGDTVYVYNGSYTENVNVSKRLTLEGEGADVVNVTNSTANNHVFEVTMDYVNISGFNVTGATGSFKAGIYLNNRQHCNISGNNASGNYYGIYLRYSSNNTLMSNNASNNSQQGIYLRESNNNNALTNNTAYLNSYGIYLLSSSNNTLTNNTANSNTQYGIHLVTSCNNNTLTSNTASNNSQQGIYLRYSSNNTLMNNNASNNSQQGIYLRESSNNNALTNNTAYLNSYGIYLLSSSNNTLTSNTGNSNNYGIYLFSLSNNNTLTNNNASNNSQQGIFLWSSSNNTLTNNNASNNSQQGIYLRDSSNNTLTNNTGNSNNYGIYLWSLSNNNALTNNTASFNTQHGIHLVTSCNNNTLTNNTANFNSNRGIYLSTSCSNNTLTNNTANSNYRGIQLLSSHNNTLANNTASFNTNYGIFLSSSSNNTIYNNYYFNNTYYAYDNGYNIWNITPTAGTNIIGGSWLGGNYWSDYAGADTTGDGLGDTLTPYNSSNNIQNGGDYHPLVQATPLLTCDCGNICINTSGWWRDGGVFHASGTRIQAAVDNATAGETIYVYNGSYTENVNVNKRLTLQGEGAYVVNVTAASASDHVFEVTANCVNISGFTLENATANGKAGIYLGDGVNSSNITNNTLKLNYNGIYLWNASDNNITCNWVHGNTRAGFNLTGGSIGNNISCNNIVANGGFNDTSGGWEWQFYNDQTQEVEAKNNYWGAAMNETTINASIYDWQDDPDNCGNVTYNPFEKDPNICAPIPELSTVILLGVGLLLLVGYLRIRRKG